MTGMLTVSAWGVHHEEGEQPAPVLMGTVSSALAGSGEGKGGPGDGTKRRGDAAAARTGGHGHRAAQRACRASNLICAVKSERCG